MYILMRKRVKACLSMLLVAVCVLTSFLFVNIDSKAQDEIVDSFCILDEEGNPIVIEITREDLVQDFPKRRMRTASIDEETWKARTNTIGVVRFKSANGLVYYKEGDTGREGYFHCKMAGDAAYIRTEGDYIFCKLAGVVMKVPKDNVKEIVPYGDCGEKELSYYYISDNGFLIHSYTYYNGSNLASTTTRVGYKPSYLQSGTRYYSYDGHYFYTDFAKMIQDYRANTYKNAVNADTPYYNYYQYLSFHTTAPFTAEEYNAYIAANKTESLMLTTGSSFVEKQKEYTVNALLMYGIAINESAWGTSPIALKKNNLFGLNAVDSSPGQSADYFPSADACIKEFAYEWVHCGYLDGLDWRYRGPHVGDKRSGMNVKYASDPYWGEKAASRGYFFDTKKVDYGRYTIGIAKKGMISFYKEADTASSCIYTSDARDGSFIYDFPVTILGEVTGSDGTLFYKAVSDVSLKNDRSEKDLYAIYKTDRDYVYVAASDVQIVFEGSGNVTNPETPTPPTDTTPPTEEEYSKKTHEEVIGTLKVVESEGYLTGFTVGGNIADLISKVKALDAKIEIAVKSANGDAITSGTVTTGMKMTITTNGSAKEYTIVIKGDLNRDGKLSAIDYVILRKSLDNQYTLDGAQRIGADTSREGKVSALDYVVLRNYLDKKGDIVQ